MGRRKFLQSAGVLTASTLPFIRTVNANESITTINESINNRVANLLLRGKTHEAQQILEKNNIKYAFKNKSISGGSAIQFMSGEDSEVSTNGHYDDSDSELTLSVFNAAGDLGWWVTATMTLQDRKISARDAAIVDDGFGITYDSSEWSAPEPTEEGVNTWCSTEAGGSVSLKYQDFAPEKGLAYDVDLPYYLNGETNIGIQTRLKKPETGLDDIPIKSEYKHTWVLLDLPSYLDAEATAGIGPIGLTVDLENCTILWEDEIAVGPRGSDSTT